MEGEHKAVIQERLRALGRTQASLAAEIGTTPANLSRTLGSSLVRQDSHWPKILEALDLEVTVQPKPLETKTFTKDGHIYIQGPHTVVILPENGRESDMTAQPKRGEKEA